MWRVGTGPIRGLLAVMLAAVVLLAQAQAIEGRVVSVADGDTVTVLDGRKVQHKVRLAGIDAPEKGMAYGQRSKQHLSGLVFVRTVKWRATRSIAMCEGWPR